MKKIGLIVVVVVVCFLVVGLVHLIHGLDVNDFDPQFSYSISDSKLNGFFVLKYDTVQGKQNHVRIDEAWVEHVWYNKTTFLSETKEKRKGLDFVVNIDTAENNQLKKASDCDKWQFVIKSNKETMEKMYIGDRIKNCHHLIDSNLSDTIIVLYERRANANDTFRLVSQITLLKRP